MKHAIIAITNPYSIFMCLSSADIFLKLKGSLSNTVLIPKLFKDKKEFKIIIHVYVFK